mgnify:CR=1 FL=1
MNIILKKIWNQLGWYWGYTISDCRKNWCWTDYYSRNEMGKTTPSDKLLEHVYEFAFKNNIKLNRLKEMFYIEHMDKNHKLLFHGAKSRIEGKLDMHKSRMNNDLGQGFIQVRDTNRRYHLFQVLKSQVCIFLILRKKV